LTELEQQLEASLAQWDGAAREAYSVAKAKWDQAANHMSQVIQKMQTTLTSITDNYDSNERNIEGSWGAWSAPGHPERVASPSPSSGSFPPAGNEPLAFPLKFRAE